jgi:hypothetical protein
MYSYNLQLGLKMKSQDALQFIEECRNDDETLDESKLADLIIWAYDQGWSLGIQDYREEILDFLDA